MLGFLFFEGDYKKMDIVIIGIVVACVYIAHEIVECLYDSKIIVERGIKDETDK